MADESHLTQRRTQEGGLLADAKDSLYPGEDTYSNLDACRGCGRALFPEDRRIADGCSCNAPMGINHGLVAKNTCTCIECDPDQTGHTRYPNTGTLTWPTNKI